MSPRLLAWGMTLWPPYFGAGVRVRRIAPDWREAVVELGLHWWNRNYVGTHFGGSLFAMTDPFFMLLLMHTLDERYLIWDKAGRIDYVAPGRGTVRAHFVLPAERVAEIEAQAAGGGKVLPEFEVDVVHADDGSVVARVHKTLYVRLKPRFRPPGADRGADE
jgi:acyl-coenzyme A thioesterase PaaI-like protein